MTHAARRTTYEAVSTALSMLSNRRLGQLVDEATLISSGIGGTAVLLEIEGTPVFAKRIPLTDLERRPENVMSTANAFGLPMCWQYGVGSAGSGVWRELAAHVMTTNWVLGARCAGFPLMYHWRVLAGPPERTPVSDEWADIDRMVAYWDGSLAVRQRLEALARSSASVMLFCEFLPHNLHDWLSAQVAGGAEAAEAACVMVERNLRTGISFMNSNGLLHFDTHFRNVLTDGHRLYVTDFGLATSPRFALSEAERRFVRQHRNHDMCYTVTHVVNWLVTALVGTVDRAERNGIIRRCADGDEPTGVPASAAAMIMRYAPVAVVMNEFYGKLFLDSRTTPYPAEAIEQACATTGIKPAQVAGPGKGLGSRW